MAPSSTIPGERRDYSDPLKILPATKKDLPKDGSVTKFDKSVDSLLLGQSKLPIKRSCSANTPDSPKLKSLVGRSISQLSISSSSSASSPNVSPESSKPFAFPKSVDFDEMKQPEKEEFD